jgi:hypothetical protein
MGEVQAIEPVVPREAIISWTTVDRVVAPAAADAVVAAKSGDPVIASPTYDHVCAGGARDHLRSRCTDDRCLPPETLPRCRMGQTDGKHAQQKDQTLAGREENKSRPSGCRRASG